jgi:hypothetical protein
VVSGDLARSNGRILAGLQRLSTFQQPDGLFSIWSGGSASVDVTARVAHMSLPGWRTGCWDCAVSPSLWVRRF